MKIKLKKNQLILKQKFNNDITKFIAILNIVTNNLNTFYSINNDILKHYNKTNKNYEMLFNISQIKNNIKSLDIDNIIKEQNIFIKIKKGIEKLTNNIEINNNVNEINELKKNFEIKTKKLKNLNKKFNLIQQELKKANLTINEIQEKNKKLYENIKQKDNEINRYLKIEKELIKVKEELKNEKNNNNKILIDFENKNKEYYNNLKSKELKIENLIKENNMLKIAIKDYKCDNNYLMDKIKEFENIYKESQNELNIENEKFNGKLYKKNNNNSLNQENKELKNNEKKYLKKLNKKEELHKKSDNLIISNKIKNDKKECVTNINEIKEEIIEKESKDNNNQELIDNKEDNKFKMIKVNCSKCTFKIKSK